MQSLLTFNNLTGNKQPLLNSKQRYQSYLKQGVLVDNYIKTNNQDFLLTPLNVALPEDLYQQDKKHKEKLSGKLFKNSLIPLAISTLTVLGAGVLLSGVYKKGLKAKKIVDPNNTLPAIGRVINMNDDNIASLYFLMENPNPQTLLGATGVIAASGITLVLKNFVDGFKEIWVKKQEADVKKAQEEALIDIETRSFSGKNKILNYLINKTDRELSQYNQQVSFHGYDKELYSCFTTNLSFSQKTENKLDQNKNIKLLLTGAGVLLASRLFTKLIFRNFKKIANLVESEKSKIIVNLENNISKLSNEDLQQELIKLGQLSPHHKEGLKRILSEVKIDPDKQKNLNDVINFNLFAPPPEHVGGRLNKYGFTAFVTDITSFLYVHLVNPTPQTGWLFTLVSSMAGLSYLGKTAVEAIKEVQVKKANSETEIELHDRLVQVELKNFMSKKASFIEPLKDKYKQSISINKDGQTRERIKTQILEEIKNGPPYIYS